MHLALSTVSQQALWVLLNERHEAVDFRSQVNNDQSQMSSQMGPLLDELLLANQISLSQIKALGVVTGPGAFTGLRMGVSFAEGLALSAGLPKIPLATYDLVGAPFIFPLRHVKAPQLSPTEYFAQGFEALLLKGPQHFSVVSLFPEHCEHRGFRGSYPWPSAQDLAAAFRKAPPNAVAKLEIVYGLDPKIFGLRTPIG